jgi:hypothetical protein
MKRMFVYRGGIKQLIDIPPTPKPTYAKLWKEHNEELSKIFATPNSFFTWSGRHYSYGQIPPLERIITDRKTQLGGGSLVV